MKTTNRIQEQISSDKPESQIHSYMWEGKKCLLAFRRLQNEMTLIINVSAAKLNKELIHFIYRLLFLFIIEERGLVYQIPDSVSGQSYPPRLLLGHLYL